MTKCAKCKKPIEGSTIYIAIRNESGKLINSVPCCLPCGNEVHDPEKDDENNARLLEYELKRREAAAATGA